METETRSMEFCISYSDKKTPLRDTEMSHTRWWDNGSHNKNEKKKKKKIDISLPFFQAAYLFLLFDRNPE